MADPPYPVGAMVRLRPAHLGAHVDVKARGVGVVVAANATHTTVRFTSARGRTDAFGVVARTERSAERVEPHGCWMGVDEVEAD
jgi:hypothetical protein